MDITNHAVKDTAEAAIAAVATAATATAAVTVTADRIAWGRTISAPDACWRRATCGLSRWLSSPRRRATATKSSSWWRKKTADWYSPSPGTVYPTLTYLEEAGYVTVAAEGSKRLYTITDEGRAYLAANRPIADIVLARLSAVGERTARMRRAADDERNRRRSLPPLVDAALAHLRDTVGKRLEGDANLEAQLVEILARAAADLQRK